MANFDTAYNNTVINHEGGYRNVVWDAGGETYRGISRRAHPEWQGWAIIDSRKPITAGKIFSDLETQVKNFYLNNYWLKMYGGYITSQAVANLIFDYYVQSGSYSVKKVQQAINTFHTPALAVDGILGNDTLAAINAGPEYKVNNSIIDTRKAHYQSLLDNGTISMADWTGILNRLRSFPYLKESIIGGTIIALLIVGIFLLKT